MKKLISYIAVFFLASSFVQTDSWKSVLMKNSFVVTYQKKNIPLYILNDIKVNSYTDIADTGEEWNNSCTQMPGLPDQRLNWAAYDSARNWVVNFSKGGYGLITTACLIPGGTNSGLRKKAVTAFPEENFEAFRKRFPDQ